MSRADRTVLGLSTFAVAVAALCVAIFSLRDTGEASASASGPTASDTTTVEISLTEFAISPAMPTVPVGKVSLHVTNDGAMVHNLSVPSLGVKTPDLQPGEDVTVDLGTLDAGDLDMLCEISGHAASGMVGMLMVGSGDTGGDAAAGTDGGAAAGASHEDMTWQEMDAAMVEVAQQFPAATEGIGGQIMEPEILADGTKVFELTTSEIDWEVAPGKIVKAMAYNGQVPGPEIHVEVGDTVRLVLTNEMDESTSIHFHGIRVPNAMDGVDPYTQPAVEPGGTFTYEFTALEPAVGIYHSHHNAQVQIPNGLFAALFIGEMPIPEAMRDKGFTKVDQEVTMVVNDAGTIGLSLNGKSFPATAAYSMKVGEVMQVTYMNEGLMAHPMHMHQPLGWIIAKDGVPLAEPIPSDTINVAPGERYTVLYKAVDPGVWAWHCHILNHAEGPSGMFGMVTAVIVEE